MICNLENKSTAMGEKKKEEEGLNGENSPGLTFIFPEGHLSQLALGNENIESKIKVNDTFDLKKVSDFYFKIKKHEELYSLGQSFTTDIKNHGNAFGFYQLDESSCVETIISLNSFFSSQFKINAIVVTCSSHIDLYKDFLGELEVKDVISKHSAKKIRLFKAEGIYLLDLDLLYKDHGARLYKEILEDLVEPFSASLWDLPPVVDLKKFPEKYYAIFGFLHNVSVIFDFNKSNLKKTQEVIDFFENYSLRLKGFIVKQEGE